MAADYSCSASSEMIRRKGSKADGAISGTRRAVGEADSPSRRSRPHQLFYRKVGKLPVVCILVAMGVTVATREVLRMVTTHSDPPQVMNLASASHVMASQSRRESSERTSPVTVQLGAQESDMSDKVSRTALLNKNLVEEKPLEKKSVQEEPGNWLGEEWDHETCVPMHKWQLPSYSPYSCNRMHELDMAEITNGGLTLINCGGSRCAFEMNDIQGLPLVVKTPIFQSSNYYPSDFYNAWLDTIIMERLSSSPFVLDVYGNCGVAQLTELSKGGNLHDLIKIARLHGDHMSPDNKLRIGFQVASAVGDMHSCDGDIPSIAHNDLCCHQFILIDGVYKLNDFHLASTLTKDRKGNACLNRPKGMNHNLDKTRAPEELKRSGPIHRDKADVWIMGNILYYVLTKKWLFEGIPTRDARQALIDGKVSRIPSQYLNNAKTNSTADWAMIKAIEMAWIYDPHDRPSAREIANFLKNHLDNNTDSTGSFWRVDIPPLPRNHRYTDSDFYRNLEM